MHIPAMRHIRFAWFLVVHKFWVAVAGVRLGVPAGLLLRHDLSKCRPSEWRRHALAYAGELSETETAALRAMHARREPHHPEYWSGRPMPDVFLREMVADWYGRGRARTGKWEAREWFAQHGEELPLHPDTRAQVRALLKF